jgi:hypothetical protein
MHGAEAERSKRRIVGRDAVWGTAGSKNEHGQRLLGGWGAARFWKKYGWSGPLLEAQVGDIENILRRRQIPRSWMQKGGYSSHWVVLLMFRIGMSTSERTEVLDERDQWVTEKRKTYLRKCNRQLIEERFHETEPDVRLYVARRMQRYCPEMYGRGYRSTTSTESVEEFTVGEREFLGWGNNPEYSRKDQAKEGRFDPRKAYHSLSRVNWTRKTREIRLEAPRHEGKVAKIRNQTIGSAVPVIVTEVDGKVMVKEDRAFRHDYQEPGSEEYIRVRVGCQPGMEKMPVAWVTRKIRSSHNAATVEAMRALYSESLVLKMEASLEQVKASIISLARDGLWNPTATFRDWVKNTLKTIFPKEYMRVYEDITPRGMQLCRTPRALKRKSDKKQQGKGKTPASQEQLQKQVELRRQLEQRFRDKREEELRLQAKIWPWVGSAKHLHGMVRMQKLNSK